MAVSEQRLTLFALISEFEADLRSIISRNLSEVADAKKAIGTEAYTATVARIPAAIHDEEDITPALFVHHLDFGDEIKLLIWLRQNLPGNLARPIDEAKRKLGDLCGVRNRVMHRRPLEFDDFPSAYSIISLFVQKAPSDFPSASSVIELFDSGNLYEHYRNYELEPLDSIILNNLPQPDFDDTGFLGRKEKTSELRKAIDGPYPVVTVLGVGGVGKTALALQVAYDLVNEPNTPFDAVIWVSAKTTRLTGTDIQNIVTNIRGSSDLASLAVDQIIGPSANDPFDDLRLIMERFRILLFVDNLETILDEKIREFVRGIPSGSKIVFTSRIGLGAFDFTIQLSGLPRAQALAFFKRVAHVWSQKALMTRPDDEIDGYLKRLDYSPLGIKWFVQAVSKGTSAQKLLANPSQLLSFCLDNILDKLSSGAKSVLNTLAITGKEQSPASLAYLCEVDGVTVEEALRELIGSNLVQVITGKFGDDDRYKIAFLAVGYISRFKAPSAPFQQKIRARLGQLRAASERAQSDGKKAYVYDPSFIFVRHEFADTDSVAAQHLNLALAQARRRDFEAAAQAIKQARDVAPSYFEVYRIEAFTSAAEGNLLLADESYEQALALRPDYPPLLTLFAGFLLRHSDENARALELLERAREVDPDAFPIRSEIVRGLLYTQRFDAAWAELDKVDPSSLPTGRARRIYYDLKADTCRRALETALTELDNPEFLKFACALEAIVQSTPGHIFDELLVGKLIDAVGYCRSFMKREKGSPDGIRVEQVRTCILECMRKLKGNQDLALPDVKEKESTNGDQQYIHSGKVSSIISDKGFGFVEEDGTSARLFFHRSFFEEIAEFEDLRVGDRVSFALGSNHQGPCAISLRLSI